MTYSNGLRVDQCKLGDVWRLSLEDVEAPQTAAKTKPWHTYCGSSTLASFMRFDDHITSHDMSFIRTPRAIQLSRSLVRSHQACRPLSTTTRRGLGEPNPRAIPDVDAMQATIDQASMVVAEEKPEGRLEKQQPDHQPDYTAEVGPWHFHIFRLCRFE